VADGLQVVDADNAGAMISRRKNIALFACFAIALIYGVFAGLMALYQATDGIVLGVSFIWYVLINLVGFTWLHYDSNEFHYRRPFWMNVGIVVIPLFFVPVYLLMSRKDGEHFSSIAKFLCFYMGLIFLLFIGSMLILEVVEPILLGRMVF
jgi:hypothetical protein